jgi:hypothetical protein
MVDSRQNDETRGFAKSTGEFPDLFHQIVRQIA